MMKTLAVVALAAVLGGCDGECHCHTYPGTLSVSLADAHTGAAIPGATFTLNGVPVKASCDGPTLPCSSWSITLETGGNEDVLVTSAPGYVSQSTSFGVTNGVSDPGGPGDCGQCGFHVQPVSLSVALSATGS